MARFFNTAGPCKPGHHYMLPPEERIPERGRMDLWLRLADVTVAMELKVWRDGRPDPVSGGLVQLDGYLEGWGSIGGGW